MLLESSFDHRVVGLSIRRLQHIEREVGVAGGDHKLAAIRGALRGRHIKVLVTDVTTARQLLNGDSVSAWRQEPAAMVPAGLAR